MVFNGNYSHGYGGGDPGYSGEQSYQGQGQGQYPPAPQQMPPQQQQQGYEHYAHQSQAAQFDQHSQASEYGHQQQPQPQHEYSNNDDPSAYGSDPYAYHNVRRDEKGYDENGYNNGDEDNERGLKEVFTKTTHDEYGTPRTQVNYLTTGIAAAALVGGGIALRNYLKNRKAEKEQMQMPPPAAGGYPPNGTPYPSETVVNQDGSQYGYNPYKDSSANYHH